MTIDLKTVGNVFRSLRKRKKMTQESLSKIAGISRTHYSKMEHGLRRPTLESLFKIAGALGMAPHELVSAIEDALQQEEDGNPTP